MSPRIAALTVALFVATGCGAPMVGQNSSQISSNGLRPGDAGFSVMPQNAPSGAVVDQFAVSLLDGLQNASILEGREYCGYITVDQTGRLSATPARPGGLLSCNMPEPRLGDGVIASYHTHGAYAASRARSAERPSRVDLIADFNYGIAGYVATPGGRVWVTDPRTRSTRQICGPYCIASDTAFDPDRSSDLRQSYALTDLPGNMRGL